MCLLNIMCSLHIMCLHSLCAASRMWVRHWCCLFPRKEPFVCFFWVPPKFHNRPSRGNNRYHVCTPYYVHVQLNNSVHVFTWYNVFTPCHVFTLYNVFIHIMCLLHIMCVLPVVCVLLSCECSISLCLLQIMSSLPIMSLPHILCVLHIVCVLQITCMYHSIIMCACVYCT